MNLQTRRSQRSVWLALALAAVLAVASAAPFAQTAAQAPTPAPAAAPAGTKKAITLADYSRWRSINGQQLSSDGKWIAYGMAFSNVPQAETKPVLTILSIPFIVVTLGLFLLVINAAMLKLTSWLADQLDPVVDVGFHVEGFWPAVGGAIVITVVGWIVDGVIGES